MLRTIVLAWGLGLVLGCGGRTPLLLGAAPAATASVSQRDGDAGDASVGNIFDTRTDRCDGTWLEDRCLVTLVSALAKRSVITLDADNVYWGSKDILDPIMAVPKSGGVPVILAESTRYSHALDLVVDSFQVYGVTPDAVLSAPLRGGAIDVVASGIYPNGLAVDSTAVYFTANGSVLKVLKGGGTVVTLAAGQDSEGIALDDANVYWVSNRALDLGGVMKVAKNGGAPVALVSDWRYVFQPGRIAVDATSVYCEAYANVTDSGIPNGALMKVAKNGGAVTPLVSIPGWNIPQDVATDGTSVYWTNEVGDSVMKVLVDGGDPVVLVSGQQDPTYVAVDSTSVYWSTSDGNVMKLTPK
jgi:hypothetical protein